MPNLFLSRFSSAISVILLSIIIISLSFAITIIVVLISTSIEGIRGGYVDPIFSQIVYIFLAVAVTIVSVRAYKRWQKSHMAWLFFFSIIVFMIGGFVILVLNNQGRRHNNPGYRNAKRIVDMKQLSTALELYAIDHNDLYPPLPSSCSSITVLEPFLKSDKVVYLGELLKERWPKYGVLEYMIAVSPDRKQFVLKATFETSLLDKDPNMPSSDRNGQILGCDCDGPAFCLQ